MFIEPQIDHAGYQKMVKGLSEAQLRHIINDAREAIEASPENPKCGYYADEIIYCAAELKRREDKRNGRQA